MDVDVVQRVSKKGHCGVRKPDSEDLYTKEDCSSHPRMAGLKGRGSAGRVALVTILVAVGLLALAPGAYAATYNVGGSTQDWTYAGNGFTYDSNWVPLQTFHVGDVLSEARYLLLSLPLSVRTRFFSSRL